MPKVKMLKGLPGSGKTTHARAMVRADGSAGRINRDDLRAMLFDSVWTGKREGIVVDIEKAIAKVLLRHNLTPIIDDTNLSPKHRQMWLDFARENDAHFDPTDMAQSIDICVERDRNRDKRVGKAVIHRMALFAGMIPWGTKPVVLVDLDGTCCDGTHRQSHLEGSTKDWEGYFAEMGLDKPIEIVVRWVRVLAEDHVICLVSGRPDSYQHQTLRWLEVHNVPYDFIFMRSSSDRRSDVLVKTDILNHVPKDRIAFALDDRPCVVKEVWRANGVRVFPVRGECEEF